MTVSERVAVAEKWRLTQAIVAAPSLTTLEHHERLVDQLSRRRRLVGMASDLVRATFDYDNQDLNSIVGSVYKRTAEIMQGLSGEARRLNLDVVIDKYL